MVQDLPFKSITKTQTFQTLFEISLDDSTTTIKLHDSGVVLYPIQDEDLVVYTCKQDGIPISDDCSKKSYGNYSCFVDSFYLNKDALIPLGETDEQYDPMDEHYYSSEELN